MRDTIRVTMQLPSLSLAALLLSSLIVIRGAPTLDLFVCCACGSDTASGLLSSAPLSSLTGAFDALRALRRDNVLASSSSTTIHVSGGPCAPPRALTEADGGIDEASRVRIVGTSAAPTEISGGLPLPSSWFTAVTDPAIIAQLPPAAVPFVLELDLAAHGISCGTLECHAYMGGQASILPGNLVPSGLEIFSPSNRAGGAAAPLTLARYPNREKQPSQWSSGKVKNYTISPDSTTTLHLPAWSAQLSNDPGSIYVHYLGGLRWNDHDNMLSSLSLSPPSLSLAPCFSRYAGEAYNTLDDLGTYYAYNILAELDEPGEYYVNRTSMKAYVWLPDSDSSYWDVAPWGLPVANASAPMRSVDAARTAHFTADALRRPRSTDPIVAYASINATVLNLDSVSFLSFENVVIEFSRDAIVLMNNASNITFDNVVIENGGSMAINVTGGVGLLVNNSVIRGAGSGAVFLYSGDRVLISPAQHTIQQSTLSYSNRYMFCYVPMVALADCGNRIIDSELFGGPHQGVFISGNDHFLSGTHLHDLVQAMSDSGAVYMGRDWTYRGNVIAHNKFERINSVDNGDDVSAVYLDDMVSGFNITDNIFIDVSRALLLGGGRDIVFSRNFINGIAGGHSAVAFDNRGMGWSSKSCTPPSGELVEFLSRVPYNTSATWIDAFPGLVHILEDAPCEPRGNSIMNNTYCQCSDGFLDQTEAVIESWGSVAGGNTEQC
jgi:hypothetical protein